MRSDYMPDAKLPSASARILVKAEQFIYLVAGYVLVVAAGALLIEAVVQMSHLFWRRDYNAAMTHLLDRVLLALMLAEIIYTVERIAQTRRLEINPFLVIGIIAAVRRILVITAENVGETDLANSSFQGTMVELGLLTVMIVLLTLSMYVLRKQDAATSANRVS